MKQRQLMEKNLAKLLREVEYRSCGSDVGQDIQENPVNPFMKRVFEKRMRGSSVASENINPNFSTLHTEHNQETDYCKIQAIIEKGHRMLENLEKSAIAQMKQIRKQSIGANPNKNIAKLLENLQKTVKNLENHAQKYNISSSIAIPHESVQSINHIQNYQCPSSKGTNPNIKISESQQKSKRRGQEGRGRNLGGSLVSQGNSKVVQQKSVYESVLEERRNRKTKQSRIV